MIKVYAYLDEISSFFLVTSIHSEMERRKSCGVGSWAITCLYIVVVGSCFTERKSGFVIKDVWLLSWLYCVFLIFLENNILSLCLRFSSMCLGPHLSCHRLVCGYAMYEIYKYVLDRLHAVQHLIYL